MIEQVDMTEPQKKARRSRAVAMCLALAAFVLLVYFGSMVKLAEELKNRRTQTSSQAVFPHEDVSRVAGGTSDGKI